LVLDFIRILSKIIHKLPASEAGSSCLLLSYTRLHAVLLFSFFWLLSFILICMQLGPKAEDVKKPVNPFAFLLRFILGTIAAAYYVLVPIYMWIKDQIVPKGMPI